MSLADFGDFPAEWTPPSPPRCCGRAMTYTASFGHRPGGRRGDAEALADRLGLPFHSVDIRAELEHFVCADFAWEYLAGRTPLPCARCNPLVKFPALGRVGEQVRRVYRHRPLRPVTAGPDGRMLLRKGQPANDQSYMLPA